MPHEDHDDGLVHAHEWAVGHDDRAKGPLVADAANVTTPSSVFHDDIHHGD